MSSEFKLAEISIDPFKPASWERIGKNLGVSILATVIASIVLMIVYCIVPGGLMMKLVLSFVVTILMFMGMLSAYERWRGCHFNDGSQ